MKILVTGGAGFIGSHLVDALIDKGNEVTVLDNLSNGRIENLSQHEDNPNFRFIKGDITNREDVQKALEGVEAVFHQAANISVTMSIEQPELFERINVGGTQTVLEESEKAGVKRLLFSSSCAVYGEPKTLPIEEDADLSPISPYGESKLACEALCHTFNKGEMETVALRYFNVYGPRQTPGQYSGVIIQFIERAKANEHPIIYGDGKQTRDFVHVSDIVNGNLLALASDKAPGQIINIGTEVETSVNQLCEIVLKLSGKENLTPVHKEERPGDIRRSLADLSKSVRILGYKPKVKLEDGLRELIEK